MSPNRHLALVVAALALLLGHASAFYASSGPVISLTQSNFESKIRSGGVWLVEFYAPWCGHCKNLKPDWEKTAAALAGIVNVAAVDCDAHQAVAQTYGVQGFPTIKFMYANSKGEIKKVDYNGGRTAKDLVTFAMDKARAFALKQLGVKASSPPPSGARSGSGSGGGSGDSFYAGTDVEVLGDSSFEREVLESRDLWLVEFYAPWCGHCKNLKGPWTEAAGKLKGQVKLGAVDCTAHQATCQQYGVQGYPTIKWFGANKQRPSDYQAGRDTASIVEFATREWSAQAPPPQVTQLTDQAVLQTECIGFNEPGLEKAPAKQLCLVAFLPNILDSGADGRNAYLAILKELAEKYKGRPFSYLWAEGGSQQDLEANFGVGGSGYPALVAFAPKDNKFSTMRSAFESKHVLAFLESVRRGYEPVSSISGALAPAAATAAWDGKDASVEAEEEFSLDDIMSEGLDKEL